MSRGRKLLAGAAATAVALASALALPGGSAVAVTALPESAVKLSDEIKETRWAHAIDLTPVRARPEGSAKQVAKLRLRMESGQAETYVALHSYTDEQKREWLRIRVPGRPNGRVGWVLRESMGDLFSTTMSVELNRKLRRVTVRRAGKIIMRAPVGIGAPGTPTPAGRYMIRERFKIPAGGVYGPRALGTTAYSAGLSGWPLGGIIGFHGTNQPGLIPGAPSHGCVRLRNKDVMRFYRLVKVGTPLTIR